ncbi:hypothetical protein [Caldivirga sp. MU80]|jgi:hypothetical protein|uniref:hypothetical protein n=1 Tax=Caldivirga sp. MU80 TaxID=1650354 RepID=UPI000831A44A|nr:hypothetical protein [Caldivirga sp. MU80]
MPKARVTALTMGTLNPNLKTFRIITNEHVSITSDGTVKCIGESCDANGTFIILEAEHPNPRELYDALRKVRILKIEVEVSGLPRQLLTRLEFLVGKPISDNAIVKYTWHSLPSFEELALALNDLNLPTHPQSSPQPHP